MEDRKVRIHAYITGNVQGVGFRWWIQKKALGFGLTGWVKNLDDKRVELVVEGEKGKLKELVVLMEKGPMFAKVGSVDVSWEEPSGELGRFEVVS